MRAAIVNPYFDTLGGGERYTASVVRSLLEEGYSVDIEWHKKDILKDIKKRFNLDISQAQVKERVSRGDGYDVCFWVSDGSIPTLRSRKNILHFQVPFVNVEGNTLMNKMKLFRVRHVVCNSEFTKQHIDQEYRVQSKVLYPPVDVKQFKPKRKENIILYVGRFSKLLQNKSQDVLIDAFKNFYDHKRKTWKLVLAGGVEVGADDTVQKLKKMSMGYPISIVQSPSFSQLQNYYGKAKVFWSASGYNIDESIEPKKVEHFGMTVVEAMAAGAIPFVLNKGGHKEIIQEGVNGFLWNTPEELIQKMETMLLGKKYNAIQKASIRSSTNYSYENFKSSFLSLL